MKNLFNMDNPVFQTLSRIADLAVLSVICLLCCLPVVTIGPATAALYYTVVKCVRRRESGAFGCYLRSFRDNLKPGLQTTLIVLPAAALLLAVHHIARWYGTRVGGLLYILYVAQYFALMLPAGVLCWLFPLLGRFEYGVRDLFRTAFQLTVAHLPSTVVLVLLTAQSAVFCAVYWWPVLFLPAAAVLLASLFTERVFRKYAPELAEPEEAPEEEE